MARLWSSGTQVDGGGSVAVTAAAVQTNIRDAILANAAWSLVEEFDGTGVHVLVLKCLASASGLPVDFFLAIWRDKTTGNISVATGESYNAGTHTLTTVPGNTGGTRTIDASGIVNSSAPTIAFSGTTGVNTNTNSPLSGVASLLATTFWSVIVDVDHVVVTVRTSSWYVGAFTSLAQAISDPMPLVFMALAGGTTAPNGGSGTSRNPGGTSPVPAGSFIVDDGSPTTPTAIALSTGLLPFSTSDKLQNALPHAYEPVVIHSRTVAQGANPGILRGKLKRAAVVGTPPTGTAVGDTFTMSSRTWLVTGVSGGGCLLIDTGS